MSEDKQADINDQIRFLEERRAKLKKEIYSRDNKLRDLQIELSVYEKLKANKEG